MNVHFSKQSNEWTTPQELFDQLNETFHFQIDAASTVENSKCPERLKDGLNEPWNKTTWCNPPYSNVKAWVEMASHESHRTKNPIVLLIPARTDTFIWHNFIFNKINTCILFIKGRLKFSDSRNSAPFPSALIVFNITEEQKNDLQYLNIGALIQ